MIDSYTAGGCKHGLDAALEFYAAHGTPFAALYVGKPASGHGNILFQNWSGKYEDVDDVINVIRDRFEGTGTDDRTRYYLTWYDEKPIMNGAKRIPMDRASQSVQFVTATPDQLQRLGSSMMISGTNNEVLSRLSAIEQKLTESDDDEPENNDTQNVIGQIIQNPAIMNVIQGLILRAVDKLIPGNPAANVSIAGMPEDSDKLSTALEILKKADPELDNDLMLLAQLAINDPGQFQFLLKMLRK